MVKTRQSILCSNIAAGLCWYSAISNILYGVVLKNKLDYLFVCLPVLKTGSYIAQGGLTLLTLPPPLPEC